MTKFRSSRCFQHLVSKVNLKHYQRADSKLKFNLEKRVATASNRQRVVVFNARATIEFVFILVRVILRRGKVSC